METQTAGIITVAITEHKTTEHAQRSVTFSGDLDRRIKVVQNTAEELNPFWECVRE